MNKKVIVTSIYLVLGFLLTWYVLKIFVPNAFVMLVNSDRLIAAGNFIDSHWIVNKLFRMTTGFITYWLYLCAVCKVKYLNYKHIIAIVFALVIGTIVEYALPTLSAYFGIIAMIVLPTIFKADMFPTGIVFTTHLVCQWLSLQIRGFSTLIVLTNSLVVFIMTIECYFWLLLFYILFNFYYKEKKENA